MKIVSEIKGVAPLKKQAVKAVKEPQNRFWLEGYFTVNLWGSDRDILIEIPPVIFKLHKNKKGKFLLSEDKIREKLDIHTQIAKGEVLKADVKLFQEVLITEFDNDDKKIGQYEHLTEIGQFEIKY